MPAERQIQQPAHSGKSAEARRDLIRVAGLQQLLDDVAADESGGTGNQDLHE